MRREAGGRRLAWSRTLSPTLAVDVWGEPKTDHLAKWFVQQVLLRWPRYLPLAPCPVCDRPTGRWETRAVAPAL
jgi:hypothetical protein